MKLLSEALFVLSEGLFEKLWDRAAAAQEDVPGHVVAGEYNGMKLGVFDERVGDIANRKEPGECFLECGNVNSIYQIFFLIKVSIGLALLLPSKHIRDSAMLLLLQIRPFYLFNNPDTMKVPQVLAGSTQVRCDRIRLFRGVAVLAIPNFVV